MSTVFRNLPPLVDGYPIDPDGTLFSIIVPEATTNLITNPSAEAYSWTGYGSSGSVSTPARRGHVGIAANASGGNYYSLSLTGNTQYTFSVDVMTHKSSGSGKYAPYVDIYFADSSGNMLGTAKREYLTPDIWYRPHVSYFASATATYRVYAVPPLVSGGPTFLATDGWQIEAKTYPTTYCDGSVTPLIDGGYVWNGPDNASTSTRSSQERSGGRILPLANYGARVIAHYGLNMEPQTAIGQEYAQIGGGVYERSLSGVRDFQLVLDFTASSYAELQRNKQALIRDIHADLVSPQQPVTLVYHAKENGVYIGEPLYIRAVYIEGMQGETVRSIGDRVTLVFRAYDPFLHTFGSRSISANNYNTESVSFIAQFKTGYGCDNLGTSTNNVVYALKIASNNTLYAGGAFTAAGGAAATNRIAQYNRQTDTWSKIGATGSANGDVYAITEGYDGIIYIAGAFTTINGVAANRIAAFNPSTNTVSALGTGLNGTAYGIAIGTGGRIYVVGSFGSAGGVANTNLIAVWSTATSTWSSVGGGITSGAILKGVVTAKNGHIIAGGRASTFGVTSATNIAEYTPSTNTWAAMAGGLTNAYSLPASYIETIAVGPDGTIYAGGNITGSGGVATTLGIAAWNGSNWSPLGNGLSNATNDPSVSQITVYDIEPDNNGGLFVAGDFTRVYNGIVLGNGGNGLAYWNGSNWRSTECYTLNSGLTYRSLAVDASGSYIFSSSSTMSSVISVGTASAESPGENRGTKAFPVLRLNNSDTVLVYVYGVFNITTGDAIYFDSIEIFPSESLYIRTGRSPAIWSDRRGSLLSSLVPGSSITNFSLVPGNNYIYILSTADAMIRNLDGYIVESFNGVDGAVFH